MFRRKWLISASLLATLSLAGCNFAPDYHPPVTAAPAAFKEAGDWSPSAPADGGPRGEWWQAFADPTLNDLEGRVVAASPTLAAAVARFNAAEGVAGQAGAAQYPTLDGRGSAVRARLAGLRPQPSGTAPLTYNDLVLGLSANYELDLWGRVRNLVTAGYAARDASADDLASVRLSLQAQCSDTYIQLRGLEEQIALLDRTVEAYDRALRLTVARHDNGASSGLDVGRAQTQLSTAKAQRAELGASRALAEHALAALVGEMPSQFTLAAATAELAPLHVPSSAPSELLQRRPDVAGAERRMAAANARIGMQRAAFFPVISLGASAGYESAHGDLFSVPSSYWALGPAVGALSLFDGGLRRATVDVARAQFDETAADYRATVLGAFRDVEDQMTLVNRLAGEAVDQDAAADAATRTADLALTRYNEGAASYLEVVTAQTAELDAQRTALTLKTRRLQASVDLIRALGGGWTGAQNADAAKVAAAAP